jgi:hypothetical protein
MIRLRLPYNEWIRAVEDGTITAKREQMERMEQDLDKFPRPHIEKAALNLLTFGSNICWADSEGNIHNEPIGT